MKSFKNFEEFEGEVIKYSDYISDKVDPDDLTDSLNNIPVENTPNNSWSVEDSQQLSAQMTGIRHPWSRDQYNKFTHPDVKKDISYEEYINMWNMKAPDDQKVIFEEALRIGINAHLHNEKSVLIVEGGPGTGKSVLAINLLKQFLLLVYVMP